MQCKASIRHPNPVKMKRAIFLILILLPLLKACEKENAFEDYQREDLVRQIGTSEMDMQIFTYYSTGNLFEYLTRFTYRKYLYNDHNRLLRVDIAQSLNPLSCAIIPGTGFDEGTDPRQAKISQLIEFDYSGNGKAEKKRSYFIQDDTEQLMQYETFEYEGDKITRIDVFNPQDQLMHFYTFHYDTKGNLDQEGYYIMQESAEGILVSRTISEFDTMHNPLRVFGVECRPGIGTNPNNILRQTVYYDLPEGLESNTLKNVYEYNSLGYPVRVNNVEYAYGEGK
jgi:hypothetical protein